MLEVLHDDKGNIKAVCDYLIVNKDNIIDKEGITVIVEELEISPEYRNNGMLRTIIKIMLKKYPKAETCKFVREYKYPGKGIKIYKRKQFELLTKGE